MGRLWPFRPLVFVPWRTIFAHMTLKVWRRSGVHLGHYACVNQGRRNLLKVRCTQG